jgi:hypothetical protein
MTTEEIHRRCEGGVSLFSATDAELQNALAAAVREIHRYALGRELDYRSKRRVSTTASGMTKNRYSASGPRCPTKRELR